MSSTVFTFRLAGFVVLILILGACNGGDGVSSTTSVAASSSTSSASTSPTTAMDPSTTTTSASTTTETSSGPVVHVVFASSDQADCSSTETFERRIDEAAEPIESAFRALLAGPTAEEQATGAGSFFSDDTREMLRLVTFENGLLTVDFKDLRPVIPNASTSCGHMSLIAQLNGTAFQFAEVDRVTYQIEGSCELFFKWLQTECQEYTHQ